MNSHRISISIPNASSISSSSFSVGTIATALFSRGPWLYVRIDSNGRTGYIPRIICSLYQHSSERNKSADCSSPPPQLTLTKMPLKHERYSLQASKQPIHRYLSHSSAIINDFKQRIPTHAFDRRDTYTLPRQPRQKERRLTLNSIHSHGNEYLPTRDTDSSSTQDSGYSDSTPFFLVQQITPENEQITLQPMFHSSKVRFKFLFFFSQG